MYIAVPDVSDRIMLFISLSERTTFPSRHELTHKPFFHAIKSGTNIIVGIARVVVVAIAIVVAIAEISRRR